MATTGSTWELKGDKANLADHVGHTVRVRGTVNHEKMHEAKEKAKERHKIIRTSTAPDGDGREDGQPQLQQVTATSSQSK